MVLKHAILCERHRADVARDRTGLNMVIGKSFYKNTSITLLGILLTWLSIGHAYAAGKVTECQSNEDNVPRAMFTTAIENREPVDRVLILDDSVANLYFFSDLRRLQGKKIKHRWEFEGKVIKEKLFEVNGPRWRVFSEHELDKEMLGRWTVVIADENDCPLRAVIFRYVAKQESGQTAAIIKLR